MSIGTSCDSTADGGLLEERSSGIFVMSKNVKSQISLSVTALQLLCQIRHVDGDKYFL